MPPRKKKKRKTYQPSLIPTTDCEIPAALAGLDRFVNDKKLVSQFDTWMEQMRALFPGVNIELELELAHAWCVKKARHPKDVRRTMRNWLNKAKPSTPEPALHRPELVEYRVPDAVTKGADIGDRFKRFVLPDRDGL